MWCRTLVPAESEEDEDEDEYESDEEEEDDSEVCGAVLTACVCCQAK